MSARTLLRRSSIAVLTCSASALVLTACAGGTPREPNASGTRAPGVSPASATQEPAPQETATDASARLDPGAVVARPKNACRALSRSSATDFTGVSFSTTHHLGNQCRYEVTGAAPAFLNIEVLSKRSISGALTGYAAVGSAVKDLGRAAYLYEGPPLNSADEGIDKVADLAVDAGAWGVLVSEGGAGSSAEHVTLVARAILSGQGQ